MAKKKIRLQLSEHYFAPNRVRKNPYYLFVQNSYGCFVFSNKRKAQDWLTKFENKYNEFYFELLDHFTHLYELNIFALRYLGMGETMRMREDLDFLLKRTQWIMGTTPVDNLSREIQGLSGTVYTQYKKYLKMLRDSNRANYLYKKTQDNFRSYERLDYEIETLLRDTNGLKEIDEKTVKAQPSRYYLKIA